MAGAPIPKVTVREIALAAGVSVTTVSRVLNRPELVIPPKREAVRRALAELDYIPNQQARSLISRRSGAVGLLVPTITNPVFAPAIAAIERVLDEAGHALLIHCYNRDPDRELKQARHLIERGVDGLIITGVTSSPALHALLARNKMPYVVQDVTPETESNPSVAFDNAGALRMAVDYLYAQGHRAIALFSGPIHNTPPVAQRFTGALERIRAFGLDLPKAWRVVTPDYDSASTRNAAAHLLAGHRLPTAIACTGDILALGLVAESRRRGIDIPGALSIIGCGDTEMGQYVDPPLTTVHMPFDAMGEAAAHTLLSLIAGRPVEPVRVLPHRLVIRDSVSRVPLSANGSVAEL
jgi:DNA-binding LacI/PurR family transcriptional regulator